MKQSLNDKFYKMINKCSYEDINVYDAVYNFIMQETKGFISENKRMDLYDLIPDLLRYTNDSNVDWIYDCRLSKDPDYVDLFNRIVLIDGLYFRCSIYRLTQILYKLNGNRKFINKKYIDMYISRNTSINGFAELFNFIKNGDYRLTVYYIKELDKANKLNGNLIKFMYSNINTFNYPDKDKIIDECIEIFVKNTDNIISLLRDKNTTKTNVDIVNKYVDDNIDTIIEKNSVIELLKLYNSYNGSKENKDFLKSYILKNIRSILKSKDIFDVKMEVALFEEAKEVLDEYMNTHMYDIICDLYRINFGTNENELDDAEKNFVDVLCMMINEILEHEGKKACDIEFLGQGGYSLVLRVGDKVVKLGNKRETEEFPNNPYIVSPILRKKLKIDEDRSIFIEVTESVYKLDPKVDYRNELYNLYKSIRELGLIWLDVNVQNVGVLKKDNNTHWNKAINTSDEALGLTSRIGDITLKPGDLVLLDADYIFEEKDIPEYYLTDEWSFSGLAKAFEQRYSDESGRGLFSHRGKKNR